MSYVGAILRKCKLPNVGSILYANIGNIGQYIADAKEYRKILSGY